MSQIIIDLMLHLLKCSDDKAFELANFVCDLMHVRVNSVDGDSVIYLRQCVLYIESALFLFHLFILHLLANFISQLVTGSECGTVPLTEET